MKEAKPDEEQRIAELFAPKSYYGVNQPKLGSKSRSGTSYVSYRNKKDFKLDQASLRDRREIFEAIFQPDEVSVIFVPTNKLLFDSVMAENPPTSIYKGVSYNPFLVQYGERFDNLDFFSWARRAQDRLPQLRFLVYDAGIYQVINEIDESQLPQKFDSRMAEKILEELQRTFSSNQRVRDNVEIRRRYLKALLEGTGVSGEFIDSSNILTPANTAFVEAFQGALDYCRDKSSDTLTIDRFVKYRRYEGDFSKSYTPLVIAEALWLYTTRGNLAKLGPTTEIEFDALIRQAMSELRGVPYLVVWYTRPDKSPDVYINNLFFGDTPDTVTKKLRDPTYRRYVEGLLAPFLDEGPLEDRVINFMQRINSRLQ